MLSVQQDINARIDDELLKHKVEEELDKQLPPRLLNDLKDQRKQLLGTHIELHNSYVSIHLSESVNDV
jgi:hypothetical protein